MPRHVLALASLLSVISAASEAAVPQVLGFSGRLRTGGADMDGGVSITFSLYTDPSSFDGANVLWSETLDVDVAGGRFDVLLGAAPENPLALDVFAGGELWLGVKVGEDPEMTPRLRVASVPYALRAIDAASVGGRLPEDLAAANHGHALADLDGQLEPGQLPSEAVLTTELDAALTDAKKTADGELAKKADKDHDHDADYVNVGEAGAVTAPMIADGAVGSGQLAPGSVLATHLGEPCAAGEVLQQVDGAWACRPLVRTPGENLVHNATLADADGNGVPDLGLVAAAPADYQLALLTQEEVHALLGGDGQADGAGMQGASLRSADPSEPGSVSLPARIAPDRAAGVQITCSVYARRPDEAGTAAVAKVACFGGETTLELPKGDTTWHRIVVTTRVPAGPGAALPRLTVFGSGSATGGDAAFVRYALPQVEYGDAATAWRPDRPLEATDLAPGSVTPEALSAAVKTSLESGGDAAAKALAAHKDSGDHDVRYVNASGDTITGELELKAGFECPACIDAADVAAGAVRASHLGEPCKDGEVLQKTSSGWACRGLDYLRTPATNQIRNAQLADRNGDGAPDFSGVNAPTVGDFVLGALAPEEVEVLLGAAPGDGAALYGADLKSTADAASSTLALETRLVAAAAAGQAVTCSVYVRRVDGVASNGRARLDCYGKTVTRDLPKTDLGWHRLVVSAYVIAGAPARPFVVHGSGPAISADLTVLRYALPQVELGAATTPWSPDPVIDLSGVADGAVATAKLVDGAVTPGKLAEAYVKRSGDTMTGDMALQASPASNIYLGVGSLNPGIELRSLTGGIPYLDFSNDPDTDRDAGFLLFGDDRLELQGATLAIMGFGLEASNVLTGGQTVESGAPTVLFKDTDGQNYFMHVNNNALYFHWDENDNSAWDEPEAMVLNGRDATIHGSLAVAGGLAPTQMLPQDGALEGGQLGFAGAGSNPWFYLDNYAGSLRVVMQAGKSVSVPFSITNAGDTIVSGGLSLAGYAPGRQIAVQPWLDLSSHGGGHGMLGGNAYYDTTDNTAHFVNTHSSLGASGVLTNCPWSSVSIFANAAPSKAGEKFTPNIVATFSPGGVSFTGAITTSDGLTVRRAANAYIDFSNDATGTDAAIALASDDVLTVHGASLNVKDGGVTAASTITASGYYWGSSSLNGDQGGSIELGGSGAPFIDFHYGDMSKDYNVRIQNSAADKLSIVGATALNFYGADLYMQYAAHGDGGFALVHSPGDKLTVNYGNSFGGGVTIASALEVTGDVKGLEVTFGTCVTKEDDKFEVAGSSAGNDLIYLDRLNDVNCPSNHVLADINFAVSGNKYKAQFICCPLIVK